MKDFSHEIFFKTARSGGSGGQNVNKVETMADACWVVADSTVFTAEEKEKIMSKLARRINKDGLLQVKSSETRSQLENKHIAKAKMEQLVGESLTEQAKRRPTRPSKAAKQKRLDSKKRDSLKKALRKGDWTD